MNELCDVGQAGWLPNTDSGCLLDCSIHPLKSVEGLLCSDTPPPLYRL